MGESLIKFCQEEKTQRKIVKLLPGVLEKATIAHTWIKKKNQTLQVLKIRITI